MGKGVFSSTQVFTHLGNFYAAVLYLSPYFCDIHLFRISTTWLRAEEKIDVVNSKNSHSPHPQKKPWGELFANDSLVCEHVWAREADHIN